MKKVFVFFAVAAMFAACNKPAKQAETIKEVIETEVIATTDSAAQKVDSTLNAVADSLAAAVK